MAKKQLMCPVFFYEKGKTGDNYIQKINVEVLISEDASLAKSKTELW